MDGHVLVLLGETSVLREVLKVITADDNSSLHLVGDNHSLQDSATDRNATSERALLVDVVALNSSLRGLEAQSDALVESHALMSTIQSKLSKG